MKHAVAIGNPFDGLTFYGPFADFDSAEEWALVNESVGEWWVLELGDPT